MVAQQPVSGAFLFEGKRWYSYEWICLLLGLSHCNLPSTAGMKKAVSYLRVSTDRHCISGLGLEAQQLAVSQFARAYRYEIIEEIVEIESGKKDNRPLLKDALRKCNEHGATLLIARLDRLARNVAFIARLIESGVDFKAIDNPFAGKLVLHIMAAFAEHERDQISERTRAALKAAKARGVRLGSHGRDVLADKHRADSMRFAQTMGPTIVAIQQQGFKTVRGITAELNRRQVPTFRNAGQNWHVSTVHKVLQQLNRNPING